VSSYVAIQRSLHKDAGYSSVVNLSFADEMTTVPLLKEELALVIQHMCVGFQKNERAGEEVFELVGLQSLTLNKNYFLLPDGRWLGGYKPAFYRGYPFALQPNAENSQLELCIKCDCIISEPTERDLRFFATDLTPMPWLQGMGKLLSDTTRSRDETNALCRSLQDAGLITPWKIKFEEKDESNNPQSKSLDGLFHIDDTALKFLPDDQVVALHKSGAMSLVYGQMYSEPRLRDLRTLHAAYQKLEEQKSMPVASTAEPDLESLFGANEDLFSF